MYILFVKTSTLAGRLAQERNREGEGRGSWNMQRVSLGLAKVWASPPSSLPRRSVDACGAALWNLRGCVRGTAGHNNPDTSAAGQRPSPVHHTPPHAHRCSASLMQTQYGGRGGGHSAVRPDVCERTPGCTRGYKHGGAGGRCSFSAPPGERRPPASSSSEGGAAPPRRKKNAPTGKRKVAKHLLAAQAAAVAEREGAAAVAVPRPKKRRSGSRKKRLASGAAGADLSEIFHRPRCSRVADGC